MTAGTRARAAGLLGAGALACGGCGAAAPAADDWPLMPGGRVLASAQTRSGVDSADHTRYRELVIAGAVGQSAAALREAALRYALRRGWRELNVEPGHRPGTPRRGSDGLAYVGSSGRGLWASVSPLSSDLLDFEPAHVRSVIATTLRARRPALFVMLKRR